MRKTISIKHDEEARATYIKVRPEGKHHSVRETGDPDVLLDVDKDGLVIGIEVLDTEGAP
jgi:uncharacterized protein YuzE